MKFKIIDTTTGREVSSEKIDKIAKEGGLMDMDIDQFFYRRRWTACTGR